MMSRREDRINGGYCEQDGCWLAEQSGRLRSDVKRTEKERVYDNGKRRLGNAIVSQHR